MTEVMEAINDTLILIENSKKLYTTYLQATLSQLVSVDQGEPSEKNAGKLLNLIASQHYYLGQLDALENLENYIRLLITPEPNLDLLKYAQRID